MTPTNRLGYTPTAMKRPTTKLQFRVTPHQELLIRQTYQEHPFYEGQPFADFLRTIILALCISWRDQPDPLHWNRFERL